MTHTTLAAGADFPAVTVPKLGGGTLTLGKPGHGHDWQMVIVYRGKHCPICTRYLGQLNDMLPEFTGLGVDVVAVSADPQEKAEAQTGPIVPGFDVGYGLTVAQMKALGLYISDPRSSAETDAPFPEPGLFVINGAGKVQIASIANAPFARPDLAGVAKGIAFVRNPANNYPIRGTLV